MDSIWKQIKQDVDNQQWDTKGLEELYDKELDVILVKEPIGIDPNRSYCTIQRNGDIVVGFYLDKSASSHRLIQSTIGGIPLEDLEIQPGEFVYIFENTHVYPIISVCYSELHVTSTNYNGLYVIYALIRDSNLRRTLACKTQVSRLSFGKMAIFRGGFGLSEDLTDLFNINPMKEYYELPNMK